MFFNFKRNRYFEDVRARVKPVELEDDFTISFDELNNEIENVELNKLIFKNFSFGDLSVPNKPVSFATYRSVVFTFFNICFQLMIRGCDEKKAIEYCSEVFPNYGPLLKFKNAQTQWIIERYVYKCFEMIKEIVDIDEICRLYTEL